MIRLVSWLISKIKRREYTVDASITSGMLLSVILDRLFMVLRGFWHKLLFRKAPGILFIGKRVKIRAHRNITVGGGMTVDDNCHINAMCKGGVRIGKNFSLGRNGIIECTGVIRELGESLDVGDNVGISPNAFISVRGPVKIGSDCIFGPDVKLFSENHVTQRLDTPIYLQGATRKGIEIGRDCWIGAGAVILDGVHIGDQVVVAAGAVVTMDVPPRSIVGGIPAKILKNRDEAEKAGL